MIVPMSKISVLGLSGEKEALLKYLMFLECVQISDLRGIPEDWEEDDRLMFLSSGQGAEQYSQMLEINRKALNILDAYAPDLAKKGLFPQKRAVTEKEFSASLLSQEDAYGMAQALVEKGKELELLQNRKNQLTNQKEGLSPWKDFPFPLEQEGTRTTKIYAGTFPKTVDMEQCKETIEVLQYLHMQVIGENSESYYAYLFFHRAVEDQVNELLRQYSFQRTRFEHFEGTYQDVVRGLDAKLQDCEKRKQELEDEILKYRQARERLQLLFDYLNYRIDHADAEEQLLSTKNLFLLQGYLPTEKTEMVQRSLKSQFNVFVEVKGVDPETDEVPTMLENNKLVEPYESITNMYSTPNYQELDPNALMAPFYFLFFGMMVSDAGYGLLTALICWFVVKKYKPEGFMRQIITMIGFGGVSTLFWGIMFGGYFGDTISIVTNGAFNIPPVLFNPLDDPMKLLILSFALGVIHIFVGIGAKVYLSFRRKQYAEGISNGCWILIITGLPMLLLGGMLGVIGKWLAIAGVVALILSKGWEEKNIFKKITTGVSGLMDITSYFSDILSYSRLLALGLSTGVIASVVNTMGKLGGNSIVGWITFVIVFLIGHTFNMVINLLGAYVHTSRLQYVEFFGKFFEGGGIAFSPLQVQSKYIKITKNN